ncbi:MAG: DNA-binding protein [Bacteroidales bacterium]|nr:DNA-binding protein [Bacteroidales bacterium]
MKLKYIFAALVAACSLAIGCTKETITVLDEVQVSSSYVALSNNEGTNSVTITVTAKDSWSINAIPQWVNISPLSGNAGETSVTFSADKASGTRENTIKITCAGKEQTIIIRQEAEKVIPKTITVAEALKVIAEYPDGSPVSRVRGIVCKIQEISTSYGNATFYISDDGKFEDGKWLQVYRGLWMNGASFTKGDEFTVGDELVIEGVLMDYKGTPETKEKAAYVIELNKSLIKVDSLSINDRQFDFVPIEGGEVVANLSCKGNGISVNVPSEAQSWISVTGIDTGNGKVTFNVAPNKGGDRSATLTFATSDGQKDYTASATIAQKGAILSVSIADYIAAAEDDTQYRISGVITKVAQDSEKYGANLYIKDATGEVYIYGTTGANGNIQTLAAFGAKEGDIVEFVGKRSSYNGTPQMAKGQFQWFKTVTPMDAAGVMNMADDDKNDPQNYIMLTGTVTKNSGYEIAPYGNFDLVDESGSILVYGVSTGWNGETKKFDTLGVKEGDVITIIAYKTSYKGNPQVVGMYVSHETPGAPVGPYATTVKYALGLNSYDDGVAIVNGTEGVQTVKIGTSSKAGDFTVEIPSSCSKLSFYAVTWKGTDPAPEVKIYDGETPVASQTVAANDGATGNAPYTLTVTDSDKYSLNVPAGKTLKVTCEKRVIFFALKAE